ncbi:hypothetical protein FA13DRAFT_1638141, partial [Coprinellus micaceus]
QPYDFDFCFPVSDVLENARVKLVPFIVFSNGSFNYCLVSYHPKLYKSVTWGPFPDLKTHEYVLEKYLRKEAGSVLFAIFDKTRPPAGNGESGEGAAGTLAGALGYINSSPKNLCTEIGTLVVLPPFQRTHVASNAVGLLLHYALNSPSHLAFPGLGLRRVAWLTNRVNTPSIRLAERLRFQREVVRSKKVPPEGKGAEVSNGKALRDGDPRAQCLGRDSVLLSLCWDDWEGGAREQVDTAMARKAQ